jgi:GNAT superfamily N-acetyltransferase
MTDMLVRLYDLPPLQPEIDAQTAVGITIRRVIGPEKIHVAEWVRKNFSDFWVSETDVAFAHSPPSCFIAIKDKALIGFACYDTTAKGFFGPTGVDESARGQGTGKALLMVCLHALWSEGYAYGIIGRVGPQDFYAKAVGAIPIPGSEEGIYRGLLR